MATEIDLLQAEIARIERELAEAKRKLAHAGEHSNGDPVLAPFSQLRGVLKNKVHFTEQEIADLKIRSRDLG